MALSLWHSKHQNWNFGEPNSCVFFPLIASWLLKEKRKKGCPGFYGSAQTGWVSILEVWLELWAFNFVLWDTTNQILFLYTEITNYTLSHWTLTNCTEESQSPISCGRLIFGSSRRYKKVISTFSCNMHKEAFWTNSSLCSPKLCSTFNPMCSSNRAKIKVICQNYA